jgi:hypothetical protein
MPETAPPEPPTPTDAAAFMTELRRLKAWSGRSYRQLERCARAAGDTLPYSTAASMLGRDRLPREELLVAFVRACGIDDAHPWAAARATLALGALADSRDRAPAPVPSADRGPGSVHPADRESESGCLRAPADHASPTGAARGHHDTVEPGVPVSPGSRWAGPARHLAATAVLLVALAVALTVAVTYAVGGHTTSVTRTVLDR